MSSSLTKISIKPKRDYNKKDYQTPVSFMLIIENPDVEILESLRDKIKEWINYD